MNLLYFIVGNTTIYHTQCYFSILSFLSYDNIDGIYIYTDAPDFYNRLGNKVHVVQLSKDKMQEWRGEADFFWRTKIKLLEDFSEKHPQEPMVYLDTDTFLYKSSQALLTGLRSGRTAYMHTNEGELNKMKHTPGRMWKQIEGKTFGGITFKDKAYMWNAGLVAVPVENRLEVIRQALNVCDEMCSAGVTRRLIEQFSISAALTENYDLQPADDMVGHYWGNKNGWNELISDFFLQAYLKNLPEEELIDSLKNFNYNQIPVYIPVKNTKKRLISLVNKLVKEKEPGWLKV